MIRISLADNYKESDVVNLTPNDINLTRIGLPTLKDLWLFFPQLFKLTPIHFPKSCSPKGYETLGKKLEILAKVEEFWVDDKETPESDYRIGGEVNPPKRKNKSHVLNTFPYKRDGTWYYSSSVQNKSVDLIYPVRPVIELDDMQFAEVEGKYGELMLSEIKIISFAGMTWHRINPGLYLCDEAIGKESFGATSKYDCSYVKQVIFTWAYENLISDFV